MEDVGTPKAHQGLAALVADKCVIGQAANQGIDCVFQHVRRPSGAVTEVDRSQPVGGAGEPISHTDTLIT